MSGVETGDLSVTNGDIQTFKKVSNKVYVWTVKSSTSSNGTTTVNIGASVAKDAA